MIDDTSITQISNINTGWIGEQPEPLFDGLSDFSYTMESYATGFQTILNRAASLLKADVFTDKINIIINKILAMIPDVFEIDDSGLYVEGGLYVSPIYRIDYIQYVMKTTIQSEDNPYYRDCPFDFPSQHPTNWAQIEVMIS